MGKRGPKPKIIDEIKLKQLASINATIEDMARQLGCSRDTLERHHKPLIDQCKAEFRARILLAQLKAAERGNAALLIWLGKQYLGQVENPPGDPPPADGGIDGHVLGINDGGKIAPVVIGRTSSIEEDRAAFAALGFDLSKRPPKV